MKPEEHGVVTEFIGRQSEGVYASSVANARDFAYRAPSLTAD